MASVSARLLTRSEPAERTRTLPRPGPRPWVVVASLLAFLALPAQAAEPAVRIVDELFVLTRGEAAVEVFQLFTLANEGTAAVQRPRLPVAEDAVRLRILRLDEGAEGVPLVERVGPGEPPRDPMELAPGERRVYQAAYRLWQSGWPLVLRRPLPYASGGATLLTRPGGLEVTGLKVGQAGREQVEGIALDVYRVEPAEPVDRWQVLVRPPGDERLPVLAGAQAQDPLDALPGRSRWWLLGLSVGAGLGALVLLARGRAGSGQTRRAGGGTDALAPWVDRLAALDLAFHRGELAEDAYRRKRDALLDAFRQDATHRSQPSTRVPTAPGQPPSVDRG